MKQQLKEIDTAIALKRQELKDIIQEELDELVGMRHILSEAVASTPEVRLEALFDKVAPTPAAKTKPIANTAPDPAGNRLAAIAKAAKNRTKTAKRYTPEQKFAILDECEYAPIKGDVLAKHGVSWQSVSTWTTQVATGHLVRPQ